MDALLISHLHYDHLDITTLHKFGDSPVVYVPNGAGKLLERAGIQNYHHVQAGDCLMVGEVTVEVVNSVHTDSRHPLGMRAATLGYLICGSCKIYFPGDTIFFPEMADFSDKLDAALLPVWGWGPDRGRMHMGPREAAQALSLLKPRIAIPIHWGTYLPIGMQPLKPRFHRTPPLEFAEFAHQVAPQVEVRVLLPGESTRIAPGSGP
jgi:L-ascorbate metabolism protein UlaG (beta-lactamase superfamily)